MTAEHTRPFWGKEHPESGQPSEIPQAPKELERLIQARADKITSKLGKEKAELKRKLDQTEQARLAESLAMQTELLQKSREIELLKAALNRAENRLFRRPRHRRVIILKLK